MTVTQSALVSGIEGGHFTDSQAAKNRGAVSGNKLRVLSGTVAVTGADFDADGDVVVLAPVHIDAVIHQIWLANDELDSDGTPTLTANVGLYTDAGGTDEKDEDAYATAVNFGQANAFQDVAFEERGIEKAGQAVWQDAGYASREAALAEAKDGRLYLALTAAANAASAASGDVSFQVVLSTDH